MERQKLTDILMSWGRIDAEKVARAVVAHRRWGKRIGQALVELGFCTRDDVLNALAAQFAVKAVDLPKVVPCHDAVAKLPANVARRHGVVPLRLDGTRTVIAVAVAAPVSAEALDAVRAVTGLKVVAYIADEDAIGPALEALYAGSVATRGIEFRWERDEEARGMHLVTMPLAACLNGV